MLTEIEWWGGLLTLWFVAGYMATLSVYKGKSKLNLTYVVCNLAFVSSILVLALYFYPLESVFAKLLYAAILLVGLLSTIAMSVIPEDGIDEPEEEEISTLTSYAILLTPFVISLALGLFKSVGIAEDLGYIG